MPDGEPEQLRRSQCQLSFLLCTGEKRTIKCPFSKLWLNQLWQKREGRPAGNRLSECGLEHFIVPHSIPSTHPFPSHLSPWITPLTMASKQRFLCVTQSTGLVCKSEPLERQDGPISSLIQRVLHWTLTLAFTRHWHHVSRLECWRKKQYGLNWSCLDVEPKFEWRHSVYRHCVFELCRCDGYEILLTAEHLKV